MRTWSGGVNKPNLEKLGNFSLAILEYFNMSRPILALEAVAVVVQLSEKTLQADIIITCKILPENNC